MAVGGSSLNRIPLMVPYVPEAAIAAVSETLRTRWIGQGPKVEEFEKRFSKRIGRQCLAVGSCTDALHLSYLLAGIGPGDEVIAPLFTCTATNIPLLYCGAKIRFADVGRDSLNVDAGALASMIDDRTRAVVAVHYGGAPVELARIYHACKERNVPLIEDCAQALGGTYAERPLGRFGDFSCFSFQAVKHIATGDGGMLAIKDRSLVEKAKRMRWFGIDRAAKLAGKWANDITEVGYKYQMTDIAAAMGLAGMDSLDVQIGARRTLRDAYARGLRGMDGIRMLDSDPESACWLCTVLVERREDFRNKLLNRGIETDQVHYRNDRYSIFSGSRGEFPNMDAIESKYLVLPLHMGMTVDDVERVCGIVRSGW